MGQAERTAGRALVEYHTGGEIAHTLGRFFRTIFSTAAETPAKKKGKTAVFWKHTVEILP